MRDISKEEYELLCNGVINYLVLKNEEEVDFKVNDTLFLSYCNKPLFVKVKHIEKRVIQTNNETVSFYIVSLKKLKLVEC